MRNGVEGNALVDAELIVSGIDSLKDGGVSFIAKSHLRPCQCAVIMIAGKAPETVLGLPPLPADFGVN